MKAIKMNNADNYESINIKLTKENTPIAYQNKLDELMDYKAFDTQAEAEKWLSETPIELELYYEYGYGLFGVEAEAIESMEIQSPYSGAPVLDESEIDQFNDDDKPQYSNDYIQNALNDDLINSIINCANNSNEIQEYKIKEIRNIIFKSITGKNLD
jgi:hypothetical protein